MFKPFVKVSYNKRADFMQNASAAIYNNSIIFLDGSADGTVPSEIWVGNSKYANYTTASNTGNSGLTQAEVIDIVNNRITYYIDNNNNGIYDWNELNIKPGLTESEVRKIVNSMIDEDNDGEADWKNIQSTSGLTEADVRRIVNSMIDSDNSGIVDWEEHTTYYMTSSGDNGAWAVWK